MRIKRDGILTEKGLPKWQQMSEGQEEERETEVAGGAVTPGQGSRGGWASETWTVHLQ